MGAVQPIHAPVGEGTQGIGVKTPKAAAVADATCGFAIEVHIPQLPIFIMGAVSAMVPAVCPPILTEVWLVAVKLPVPGGRAIVH